jgi:O-antigen ligase
MDALLLILILAIITNIWQVQQIIPGLAPLRLGILSVIASAAAAAFSTRRFTLLKDPDFAPIRFVLVIGAIAIIGGPFAILRGRALDFVIKNFAPTVTLAFLVAHRIRSPYSLRWLVDAFLIGGLPYIWTFVNAPRDFLGKPFGMPFYDANDGGMLAVTCFAFALARVTLSRTWLSRALFFGVGLLYLYIVVRSSSRGAMLALTGTTLVILLTVTSVPAKWRFGSLIAVLGVLLVAGSSTYWSLMSTLLKPQEDYNWAGNDDSGRMELWKRGFSHMLENPVLGGGASNYSAIELRSEWARRKALAGEGAKLMVAHNAYVEIGAELGVSGLLAFLAMIAGTMRRLWVASRRPLADPVLRRFAQLLFAALTAFVSGSLFLSSQYWPFFYTLIALSVATAALMSRSERARVARLARPVAAGATPQRA